MEIFAKKKEKYERNQKFTFRLVEQKQNYAKLTP